jgi:Ca2+-binding RTX toxin-like protein
MEVTIDLIPMEKTMTRLTITDLTFGGLKIDGSDLSDLIFGSFDDDRIAGNGGNDLVFGLVGNDRIAGGEGDDQLFGGIGRDVLSGGDGEDRLFGGIGNDRVVGNKGDDRMFGGQGDDLLVWNNGDGSDLMNGGKGHDRTQVNFDTDLVDDDLQNKDVAQFSTTPNGVQFARIEVNDQTERGLFQLDIRQVEALETNFGGGADTAVIVDDVLNAITLDLDGGDGIDLIDASLATAAIDVNLAAGTLGQSMAMGFENVVGTEFDDRIVGDAQDNVLSGLGGTDRLEGRDGDDILVGGKGDDRVFGGKGDDLLVWNNGDGSDLLHGGKGHDIVQVNFDTDLVDDDLQNDDVAQFSVTARGVQFARIEVNGQTERGLFQLDIRETETLETNFGGGVDRAVIVDDVLDRIALDLDGGKGTDTLDLGRAASGIRVDLKAGTLGHSTAVGFENVVGTAFGDRIAGDDGVNVLDGGAGNDRIDGGDGNDILRGGDGNDRLRGQDGDDQLFGGDGDDRLEGGGRGFNTLDGGAGNDRLFGGNGDGEMFGGDGDDVIDGQQGDDLIRGGAGNDILTGGEGADTFLFVEGDIGVDVITDFEIAVDRIVFQTTDPAVTTEALLAGATQAGDDVELTTADRVITIQDILIADLTSDAFLIA